MCSRNLAFSVALILVLVPLIHSETEHSLLSRRQAPSFFDLGCRGTHDTSALWRLDKICEDCYSLFHEPEVKKKCRSKCFQSQFFEGCMDTLQLRDDIERIKDDVKLLNGGQLSF